MNKIKIECTEAVKVEINDSGFYIELNPLDTDFPLRIEKATNALSKLEEKLEQEIFLIDKREDVPDGLLTRNTRDKLLKYKEYNNECGKVIDNLFGEGTSKACFGNKNYLGMYNDLFDSLTPIMKDVYGDANKLLETIKAKYSKKDSDVLS